VFVVPESRKLAVEDTTFDELPPPPPPIQPIKDRDNATIIRFLRFTYQPIKVWFKYTLLE